MLQVNDLLQEPGANLRVIKVKIAPSGHQVVLVAGWNESTPFVVWRTVDYGKNHRTFSYGNYCVDIEEALEVFHLKN